LGGYGASVIDGSTTIAGITIPSSDPLFLGIVAIHVPLGMLAAASGVLAMLSTKAPGRHPRFGTLYFWFLTANVVSATALSSMRWADTYHLFLLGVLALAAAALGRMARRRLWKRWALVHLVGMGSSFILMLTAFYVDNGHQLPLLSSLPSWTYWMLPAVVGVPVIARAIVRHPVVRQANARRADAH
jgi:hypothetical protein